MPFGIHKHSNRSKQALNEAAPSKGTATPTSESSASSQTPVFAGTNEGTTQPQAFVQQQRVDANQYAAPQGPAGEIDRGIYPNFGDIPARSQSTRYRSSYPQAAIPSQAGSSTDDLALHTGKIQIPQQQQQGQRSLPQSPIVEQKKSKSIFDRMRSSKTTADQKPPSTQSSYNNTTGLARRLSKRQEVPPTIRTVQQSRASLDQQRNSRYLPSPREGVEDAGLDPYLIREPEEEEEAHSGVQEQDPHQQITRPSQSDSEPPIYATNEDVHNLQEQDPQFYQSQYSAGQHQQFEAPPQSHYLQTIQNQQLSNNPDSLGIIHDHYRQQNPETVSQLSYESPTDQREELQLQQQQRPVSVQSNGHSPTGGQVLQRAEYPNRTTSIQGARPLSQYSAMAPPAGTSQPNRRPADPKQTMQGNQSGPPDSRDGPPPGYRQTFPGNSTPTTGPGQSPIPPVVGNQGPNYRGGPPQREQYGPPGGGDQGRSTPPPAPSERDVNDAYKELLQKYKKVKGLYFDKTAQVEQLQNTLANQRLSQSRTSLDDSEYMTRFQRLDGATTNLAFNIRKDWRSIPPWIAPYVNQDAMKVGKQEMTAVGRACITRFLVEEIFTKSFHPGLEVELSENLKNIEQNIRRFSPVLNNVEESDALTAKVVQWRLATLDGLREVLGTPESEEFRKQFSRVATTNLTASLINFLQEPVPAGIEDSAHMIVELAVSIAANLPLESRDISIIYPMPGDLLQPLYMKVESGAGMPALENPGVDLSSEVEASSTASGDKEEAPKDSEKGEGKNRGKDKPKTGMLQAMMGGNSTGAGPKQKSNSGPPSAIEASGEGKPKNSSEDGSQKVRFAGFVGIEVRGRQMLGKAPVWTIS